MNKPGLLALHRSLALAFAPLLLLQALTGAALLFREPLARLIDPAGMSALLHSGPAASIAKLATSAEAAMPGFRLRRIFLPAAPEATALAELAGSDGVVRYASLDPGSARVLASGSIWRFPMEAALQLHYRLMDGRLGLAIVLLNGLALLALAGSGLGFWWPGRKRALKSLAIRKSLPARARLRGWHRTGGVAVSLVILSSALSGVLLVVPDLAATPAAAAPAAPDRPSPAMIDGAVARAQKQFPAAGLRDIRFPPADRIDVNFLAPEHNPRAVHVVSVRLSDGEILKRLPAQANPVLWMKVLTLHTGDSAGLAGRLLLLAEALVLALLAVSGPVMWWQARRRRQKGR